MRQKSRRKKKELKFYSRSSYKIQIRKHSKKTKIKRRNERTHEEKTRYSNVELLVQQNFQLCRTFCKCKK